MNIFFYSLIIILAGFFAFKSSFILGIIFIALVVLYFYFTKYDFFMSKKGNIEYSNGNLDNALLYYKKAVSKGKASPITRINYAMMLLRSGDPEKALKEIDTVLSVSGMSVDVKHSAKQVRSVINYKLKNFDEAYEEALEIYEEGHTISIMRCIVGLLMLTVEKDNEKVLNFCEEAYDYDSDSRDIVDNYLLALINSNKLEEAKKISEELIDMAPEFLEGYYHRALLYKALGENEKAKELLDKTENCKTSYMTTVSKEEIEALRKELK